MRLDTALFIELLYIAVLSGTLSTLITQKIKENIGWLEGIAVIILSFILNFIMAFLFVQTVVEVDGVYWAGAIALITLIGFIDAQVFYSLVKDKWAMFENKPKPEKPTDMDNDEADFVQDVTKDGR